MHEADGEWSQPFIERDPAEPIAIEPRQRRLFLGVPVRIGTVTVQVPVQIVAMGMQMIVERGRADVRPGCPDGRASGPGPDRSTRPIPVR